MSDSDLTAEDLEEIAREESSVRRPDGSTITLADVVASTRTENA